LEADSQFYFLDLIDAVNGWLNKLSGMKSKSIFR
jgi:hypothetical protein